MKVTTGPFNVNAFRKTLPLTNQLLTAFFLPQAGSLKMNNCKPRFSQRLWISTTNKWGSNAEQAIRNQYPPVTRINLFDLIESPVDWDKLEQGVHGEAARTPKKTLRPHQKEAIRKHISIFNRLTGANSLWLVGQEKPLPHFVLLNMKQKAKDLFSFWFHL
jgi:hypothetical protein